MAAAPTWAQVARKKKPPAFLPTECAVNLEQFDAPQGLPPSSSRYSTFIPLPSAYKQGWAMDIVTKLPSSAVGMVPHADVQSPAKVMAVSFWDVVSAIWYINTNKKTFMKA